MSRNRGCRIAVGAAVAVSLAATMFGCSGANQSADTPEKSIALVDLFGGFQARYAHHDDPRDLEASPNTALSASGRVVGVEQGPNFADADPNMPLSGRMILVNVEIESVGKAPASPPTHVGVLLFQGTRELSDFQEALPAGTSVALYLTEAKDLEAGAPTLYMPVTPQGFIVADPDGVGVTYPMEHRVVAEARLEDVAPRAR